jgi:hypothetical protein
MVTRTRTRPGTESPGPSPSHGLTQAAAAGFNDLFRLLARLSGMQVMQLEACQCHCNLKLQLEVESSLSIISVFATSKLECLSQLEANQIEANHNGSTPSQLAGGHSEISLRGM